MKKTIILFAIILSGFVFGQETKESTTNIVSDNIYEKVDKDAVFPGGMNAFRAYITDIINMDNVKGRGIFKSEINFIVNENGEIFNVKVTGNNQSMNKEITRVIMAIKTKWIPAINKGTPVKQRYRMSMTMNFE